MGLKTKINASKKNLHKQGRIKRKAFKARAKRPSTSEITESTIGNVAKVESSAKLVPKVKRGKNSSIKQAQPLSKPKMRRLKTQEKFKRQELIKKGLLIVDEDMEEVMEAPVDTQEVEESTEMQTDRVIQTEYFIMNAQGTTLGGRHP